MFPCRILTMESSKLIGNSMILGTLEILAESYTLAEKSGIAASEVHDLVRGILTIRTLIRFLLIAL